MDTHADDDASAESSAPENPFAHLPDPVRIEDTVTSAEVSGPPPVPDSAARDLDWLLRTTGGGL